MRQVSGAGGTCIPDRQIPGLLLCLRTWKAAVVFILFVLIMMVQVNREEKRLEADFGEEYRAYKTKTRKILPFIW